MKSLFQHKFNPAADNLHYEYSLKRSGVSNIAGTDEVGRGPLAGPVVASSVILPDGCDTSLFKDSKVLSVAAKKKAFDYLHAIDAAIGIAVVAHTTIDQINILQASLTAMKLSLEQLLHNGFTPDHLLVDGKFQIPHSISQTTIIKGDSKSASISAASIIAKITRDTIMEELHEKYPVYNFKKNKGYPTKEHRDAIKKHGYSPYHRLTFKGVKEFVQK